MRASTALLMASPRKNCRTGPTYPTPSAIRGLAPSGSASRMAGLSHRKAPSDAQLGACAKPTPYTLAIVLVGRRFKARQFAPWQRQISPYRATARGRCRRNSRQLSIIQAVASPASTSVIGSTVRHGAPVRVVSMSARKRSVAARSGSASRARTTDKPPPGGNFDAAEIAVGPSPKLRHVLEVCPQRLGVSASDPKRTFMARASGRSRHSR